MRLEVSGEQYVAVPLRNRSGHLYAFAVVATGRMLRDCMAPGPIDADGALKILDVARDLAEVQLSERWARMTC
jgi:hypothetical protein